MNRHNDRSGNFSDGEPSGGRARDFDRSNRRQSDAPRGTTRYNGTGSRPPMDGPTEEARPAFMFDAWSLLRPAMKRWYWLLFGAVLGAVAGVVLGLYLWKTYYSAVAQIVRTDAPVASDAYRPQQLNGPTLVGMIESPEIMKKIAEKMRASGSHLSGGVRPAPERNSEIVTISATGHDLRSAITLANMFNAEVIEFTREHQRKEADEADVYVQNELKTVEGDLQAARDAMPSIPASALTALEASGTTVASAAATPAALDRMAQSVEVAREKLAEALVKYTDAHPEVRGARARLAELEAQLQVKLEKARPSAPAATGSSTGSTVRPAATPAEYEIAYLKVRTLENLRSELIRRQRAIQVFRASPPGNFKVLQPATVDTVAIHPPWMKVILLGGFFGMIGLVASGAELLRREVFDTRLKTESDVARVTGLPVIATLGDIRQLSLAQREAWAFRSWIALQDRLAFSPNHGLICGITSSNSGDGRSTWINLLAGAARKCGFRVLTIATRPTADAPVMTAETTEATASPAPQPVPVEAEAEAEPVAAGHVDEPLRHHGRAATRTASSATTATSRANGTGNNGHNGPNGSNGHTNGSSILSNPADLAAPGAGFGGESEFTALTASALFTPAMVTEKLMGTESDPLVHIPLPGWTWNLERRKQWQGALNVWRKIDNVVILVELPPASMPESVLLASNLPNLLWLAEADKSEAADTRAQLQTLRHARCNLVGAVINRALAPVANGRFSRWIGAIALFATLGLMPSGNDLNAAELSAPAAAAVAAAQPVNVASFSVSSPAQRAQWQQKLTLGPGDVLNLSIYGDPELTREEVPVGPDGRISYLEAQNVVAAGLTVDELRERLNEELGKYRRAPQAYVVPVTYKSKKYYVLGKVAQRGAFPLDRPMTLIEAVARARGMETGLAVDRSMVELADMSRAFVARNGQKLQVDFEKLFNEGDLAQNIALEPNDYIYFPATDLKEIYVLGAVRSPGGYQYQSAIGAIGAIAARGGFTDRAFKKKLLVIRGSMGRPETFEVNAHDVFSATTPDFKLQPRDIVYVSERPWIRAEEILDAAASAFVTSAVVTWTSDKVSR